MSGPPAAHVLQSGLYEQLVTAELEALLQVLPVRARAELESIDRSEAPHVLARYVREAVVRTLNSIRGDDAPVLLRQVEACNRILHLLAEISSGSVDASDQICAPPRQLWALTRATGLESEPPPPVRPAIPLSSSALLVNAPRDLQIGHEICRELASADRVDLLCAFLKWTGLRLVKDAMRAFLERTTRTGNLPAARIRVITGTYMGATDRRALDELIQLGRQVAGTSDSAACPVEVYVSYDSRRTRLHAKAWLFHRNTGYSTAYIGSSNLSKSALLEGLEWNVRVSAVDAREILDKFQATFDSYWEDCDFESYLPERDAERLDRALAAERGESGHDDSFESGPLCLFEVRPYPFQREILERLDVERHVHDRWRNLVVAATGTGKTMIAAFDYKRLREQWGHGHARLLFVAHRDHILKQSLARFRAVLGEPDFGGLMVGGQKSLDPRHVFASVQTLSRMDLDDLDAEAFDVIVVDEFHHAAAPTYRRLLEHFRPRVLLGLTATPERADGLSVLDWFDGRMAAQLRLWHALERQLLCPFQYFGVFDEVDLSRLRWSRGFYDAGELDRVYTGDRARVRLILRALQEKVLSARAMRAIGFCATVGHSEFMAQEFTRAGIPARTVVGDTQSADRETAIRHLRERKVNVLFTVDVLGEGVDIPEVDTVLLLRPTESATVFQQQLGRGLRLSPGKSCLTVLDFIGQANRQFRFDQRFACMMGGTRAEVRRQIESGFPFLPSGCAISLDRVAQEVVLENLRTAVGQGTAWLVEQLKAAGPTVGLSEFLQRTESNLGDVYRGSVAPSWVLLRRRAGFEAAGPAAQPRDEESRLLGALRRTLHIDDVERLDFYQKFLAQPSAPSSSLWTPLDTRVLTMLHLSLFSGQAKRPSLTAGLAVLWHHEAVRRELLELFSILRDRVDHFGFPLAIRGTAEVPLKVHCTYSRDEISAAFGKLTAEKGLRSQAGVLHDAGSGHDIFFITTRKSEKDFSPTTMYRDYAISSTHFHWESQSTTRADSPTGLRYQGHGPAAGTHALLFVRETVDGAGGQTNPYIFLGPADYVRHQSERPMAITWRLHYPTPDAMLEWASLAG